MNWNLLTCAVRPHVSYAPTEPAVRAQLRAETPAGAAWRCLRCGTFVPGPPTASGPAAAAPRVRRDDELRSALILRAFAVERFLRAILFGFIAYGIWRFKYRGRPSSTRSTGSTPKSGRSCTNSATTSTGPAWSA